MKSRPALHFIVAALCLMTVPKTKANNAKYEHAKIDIIVLVDGSNSIVPSDYQLLLDVVLKLPTIFPLGPTKARVALATFSEKTSIMPQLFTDNIDTFNAAMRQLSASQQRMTTQTHVALDTIRNSLLQHVRPDVAKALILLTDGCTNSPYDPNPMEKAENTAKWMRDQKEIRIFVVHIGTAQCPPGLPGLEQHQINIAGDPRRRFHYTQFSEMTEKVFEQVKKEIAEERCRYKEVCYYPSDDKSTCSGSWEKDTANSKDKCIDHKPDTESKCTVADCKSHCSTAWSTGDCTNLCVGMPTWCVVACERCALPDAATTVETTPDDDGNWNTDDPKRVDPTPKNGRKGGNGGSSQWWYIGLGIGVAVFLLLVLIIVGAVLSGRSRRRKKHALLHAKMEYEAKHSRHSKSMSRSKSRSRSKWTGRRASRVPRSRSRQPQHTATGVYDRPPSHYPETRTEQGPRTAPVTKTGYRTVGPSNAAPNAPPSAHPAKRTEHGPSTGTGAGAQPQSGHRTVGPSTAGRGQPSGQTEKRTERAPRTGTQPQPGYRTVGPSDEAKLHARIKTLFGGQTNAKKQATSEFKANAPEMITAATVPSWKPRQFPA